MRYLQGIKDYMLIYTKSNQLKVIRYSNVDLVVYINSRKSMSGYIFMLVGGTISQKKAKQLIIASSTKEVDFIACFKVTSHALWLRILSQDLVLLT